jgi:hypothetical protein
MNKMLVVIFDNETAANAGLQALRKLHADGDITLYAAAVLGRDANGVLSLKKGMDAGPVGAGVGLAVGSMIGLLGGPLGLVVGAVTGAKGAESMQPFTGGLFKGFLAFFLLEMGLLVGRQLRDCRDVGPFLVGFGLVMPPLHAIIALLLARMAGTSLGDATLLAVLAASASYIVVPAVVRYAIPEARPSRYFTMSLAITFPFNVLIGIPLYYAVASRMWN